MTMFSWATTAALICAATAVQAQVQTTQTLTLDFAPPDMVVHRAGYRYFNIGFKLIH